jgi:LCP family protein required for cell wall assembly
MVMSDVDPPPGATRSPRASRSKPKHAKPAAKSKRAFQGVAILVVFAVVALATAVGYGWYRYSQIGHADLTLDSPSGSVQNILIVGSDSRAAVDRSDPDSSAFLNAPGADSAGQRSDTIMVARVDPKARTVDLLSFPRDLWIPIAPSGSAERINTAFADGTDVRDGAQRLIDTIKANFGISINHYVQINFKSFKGVVEAVGGVPMYFDKAVRDTNSGLYQYELGCVSLDGEQGLAYARSRHLEYLNSRKQWVDDPTGDLGRINRQTYFLRTVLDRAQQKFGSFDVKAINGILSSTADNLILDKGFSVNQLAGLAKSFKGFSGEQIESHALPVYPDMTNGGASILRLDQRAAEDIFNVFRGKPAGTVLPSSVALGVSGATGVTGQSSTIITRLSTLGFHATAAGDIAKQTRTSVRYAPGYRAQADLVARHLAAGADLKEDTSLSKSRTPVMLIVGADYTDALETPTAPTTTASPTTTAGVGTAPSSTSTTSTTMPTHSGEVTELVGVLAGKPPAGTVCN